MRLLSTLFCTLLLAVVAVPGYAGDKPAGDKPAGDGPGRGADEDVVSKLTPGELELLKKKLPDWDGLDRHKQNRIARHVLRLREMGPVERERFKERMEQMRKGRRKPAAPDVRGRRDHRDHPSVFTAAFGQAIESMLELDWPEGLKLADERKWSRARLVGSFLRHKLMRRLGAFELEQALADDFDIKAHFKNLPESKQKRIATMIEKARAGDKPARDSLGRLLFHVRMRAFRGARKSGDIAQQVRTHWSKPYRQALDDVRNDIAGFTVRVETPRGSRGPVGKREWAALAWKLEEVSTRAFKQDPGLTKDADVLLLRILRDQLKVPAEKLESLPARGDPQRRRAFVKLFASRENHFGRGGPRRRPDNWPRGWKGRGEGAKKADGTKKDGDDADK